MKKKIIKTVLCVLIVPIVYLLCVNTYIIIYAGRYMAEPEHITEKQADAVIILGAGVRADGSLSPMLRERLDMGIRLYRQGAADCLLVSGDHGRKEYDEVNAMKSYAMENGVPSERIFMDHAGFSTYETMYRAKEIFQVKKAIVVTQKYHMYRSLYIAEKLGIDAEGVPCDTRDYAGQLYRSLREILARNKDFLTVIFKPEPAFLGDAIPVSTDGNLTNDK